MVTGSNGQGKTSLLEAVAWLATGRSLRGVPDRVLVRTGADEAIVRAEIAHGDHDVLIEAAIRTQGRNRILANKQAVTRRRDLAEHLRVTVFAPDDLALVKGAPAGRRDFVDDLLVASTPRLAGVITDYERVVKQRNALLRAGIRNAEDRTTRDVLNARLVASGAALVDARLELIERLTPAVRDAYASLAGDAPGFATSYEAEWSERPVGTRHGRDGDDATRSRGWRAREEDRGITLVGPHRDDWTFVLDGMDARHHASQGEQRTLALGLRLAGHRVVADVVGAEPLLLLDDVFSELDAHRAAALVAHLPATQTLVTTAGRAARGDRGRGLAADRGRPGRCLRSLARSATRCGRSGASSARRRRACSSGSGRCGPSSWATRSPATARRCTCGPGSCGCGVDDPAWGGQFRYLADTLVAALAEQVPDAAIREISVTAGPARSEARDPPPTADEWSDGGGEPA